MQLIRDFLRLRSAGTAFVGRRQRRFVHVTVPASLPGRADVSPLDMHWLDTAPGRRLAARWHSHAGPIDVGHIHRGAGA